MLEIKNLNDFTANCNFIKGEIEKLQGFKHTFELSKRQYEKQKVDVQKYKESLQKRFDIKIKEDN